jgi:5-methylcytosine-specific restriction endonuclease McrBC regulatory subunit McrC
MGTVSLTATVEEILEKIDVKRSFRHKPLLLNERSRSPCASTFVWNVLATTENDSLSRLGIELDAEVSAGELSRVITTENMVGAARIASELGVISVTIQPKVDATRIFSIINYLAEDPFSENEIAEIFGDGIDLTLSQVKRCTALIDRAISSGSIRGYKQTTKALEFVRGKPNFKDLLATPFPEIEKFECTYSELTIDKCAKLLRSSSSSLAERASELLFALSKVSDTTFSYQEISREIRLSHHHAAALAACRDIICNLHINAHPGQARYYFSYALNMSTVFQDYCQMLFKDVLSPNGYQPATSLEKRLSSIDRKIRLDGLYIKADRKILIECKYKDIEGTADISLADIYQTTSYCAHNSIQPEESFLLFPCTGTGQAIEELPSISDFSITSNKIRILKLNMNCSVSAVLNSLEHVFDH